MLKQFLLALMGGIMIAIGGCVYLGSSSIAIFGSAIGAFFFSVALVSICYKGYGLFTGRVGYLPVIGTKAEAAGLGMTLLGNFVATTVIGYLISLTLEDSLAAAAKTMTLAKLAAPWYATFVRAILCGVLMYLAVSIFRERKTIAGILFCVPAFILAGFEHSIADMFYLAASGMDDIQELWFLLIVIVGNAIGGMLLPLITSLTEDAPEEGADAEETEPAEAADEVAE